MSRALGLHQQLHQLICIEGYTYKQANCSCGWQGRKWDTVYGTAVDRKMRRAAKREWKFHRDITVREIPDNG